MRLTLWAAWVGVLALGGCAADPPTGHRAPIVDHSVAANGQVVASQAATEDARPVVAVPEQPAQLDNDWRPQVYKVQAGDTLYGIAFNFGLDYHDLAEINHIPDPTLIHPGQEIRLFPVAGAQAESASGPVIKEQPLAVKLPYSEQAVAQLERPQAVQAAQSAAKTGTAGQPPVSKQGGVVVAAGIAPDGTPVKWEMPASGKVVAGFSEADNRKGIDIAGKLGQPIYASAPGKVIFCGSGLRGYGKLVIIKHNATYLSAYAHNDKLLVKEGQMVSKGQMIAQMGSTDADRVALHFEIRKLGKPVDPAKYLVFPKS